jgi:hypothetical protein
MVVLVALVLGGDLGADIVHVEVPYGLDDLLEAGRGQRPGLGEDQDAVTEGHQRRDRRDARRPGKALVRVGVDLPERDVLMLLARRPARMPGTARTKTPTSRRG